MRKKNSAVILVVTSLIIGIVIGAIGAPMIASGNQHRQPSIITSSVAQVSEDDADAIALFNAILNMPQHSNVIISAGQVSDNMVTASSAAMLIELVLRKGHRLFLLSPETENSWLLFQWANPIVEQLNSEYGRDFIKIGDIKNGIEFFDTAPVDFSKACNDGVDYQGTALESFEIMRDVKTAKDFALVICLEDVFVTRYIGYGHWLTQWQMLSGASPVYPVVLTRQFTASSNIYPDAGIIGAAGERAFRQLYHAEKT